MTRYDHLYTIAFTVESDDDIHEIHDKLRSNDPTTVKLIYTSIIDRIKDVQRAVEFAEAIEHYDTIDLLEDQ